MEVCSSAMGPERVLPSSEDELGEDKRSVDGAVLPAGAVWDGEGEVGEDGGDLELDEEEEEEGEEASNGEYYYQPLNQDPDGLYSSEQPEEEDRGEVSHSQQLQQVQHRIEVRSAQQQVTNSFQPVFSDNLTKACITFLSLQVMGLHLPEAPPPDSDEEEDPEGAAAQRSRASIPMDADHVELVKRTMAAVALPSLGVPPWAQEISDDQWKDMVQHTLQERQSSAGLRMLRRSNVPGL
ncbi:hypothetical protein XENOCAPTIV_017302 [Xenoophorus captivus]|uniref:Male-enhanced antigen 1 n=2 Tax=Goodeidae TaxID=28758 RepID=A0ABV0R0T8_9TELE